MDFPLTRPASAARLDDARALFALLLGDALDGSALGWRDDFLHRLNDEAGLLEAIEYHGLAPALYYRLRDDLSGEARTRLKLLAWRQHRFDRFRQAALVELLAAFHDAGLPLILLKGAALANSVYPASDWRPMSDIDVLIPAAQADASLDVLHSLGYQSGSQPLNRRLLHHHLPTSRKMVDDVALAVELHTDVFSCDVPWSLDASALPASLPQITIGSHTAAMLPPDWQLAHLAIHQSEPALWPTFKGYLDALLVIRAHPEGVTHTPTTDDARVIGHYYARLLTASLAPPLATNPVPPALPGRGIPTIDEMQRVAMRINAARLLTPSDWWLRMRYGVDDARAVRWRHRRSVLGWGLQRIPSWVSGKLSR